MEAFSKQTLEPEAGRLVKEKELVFGHFRRIARNLFIGLGLNIEAFGT
jgi:hypothetical protein